MSIAVSHRLVRRVVPCLRRCGLTQMGLTLLLFFLLTGPRVLGSRALSVTCPFFFRPFSGVILGWLFFGFSGFSGLYARCFCGVCGNGGRATGLYYGWGSLACCVAFLSILFVIFSVVGGKVCPLGGSYAYAMYARCWACG